MGNKKFKSVVWAEELTEIEQNIFRIMLNKLPKDYLGKILNFTVNPDTQVVSVEYRLNRKGAKEIASVLRTTVNKIPADFPNRDGFKKMLLEECKMYRTIVNRYNRALKETSKNDK
jgi:hypothetical protein